MLFSVSFFSFYFKLTALSIVVGLVDIAVVIAFVSCFIYLKVISMTEEEEEEDDENTATNTNEHPENLEGGGLEMVVPHNSINPLNKNDKSKRVQNNALFMQEAPPQPVKRPGSKKRTKSSPTQAEQLRKKRTKSMEARRARKGNVSLLNKNRKVDGEGNVESSNEIEMTSIES